MRSADSAIATIFGVSFAVSCWLNVTSRGRAVVLGQPRSRDKGGYHGDWPGAS